MNHTSGSPGLDTKDLLGLGPYWAITPNTGRGFWSTEADHTVSLGSSEPFNARCDLITQKESSDFTGLTRTGGLCRLA